MRSGVVIVCANNIIKHQPDSTWLADSRVFQELPLREMDVCIGIEPSKKQ